MATLLGAQLSTFDLETVVPTAVQSQSTNDFRLTLTTALPVTTADVTAATTIYFTPFIGNKIALYSGSAWVMLSSAEVSLALGTLVDATNYDVFAYSNSGTLTLEALAWTNDTTRATALVRQDGVWCKTGVLTRRYVGTFRTTSTTTTEDSVSKRFLWNVSNRRRRRMFYQDSTANWTYSTQTWRQTRNQSAAKVEFVVGLSEDPISCIVKYKFLNGTAGVTVQGSAAMDSITGPSGDQTFGTSIVIVANQYIGGAFDQTFDPPAVGYHYIAQLELAEAVGTTTWLGATHNGLFAEVWA